jgi:hypothetical protein
MAGKLEHWVEVRESLGMFFSRPDIEEIGARVGVYAAQDIPVLAPEREAVEA